MTVSSILRSKLLKNLLEMELRPLHCPSTPEQRLEIKRNTSRNPFDEIINFDTLFIRKNQEQLIYFATSREFFSFQFHIRIHSYLDENVYMLKRCIRQFYLLYLCLFVSIYFHHNNNTQRQPIKFIENCFT